MNFLTQNQIKSFSFIIKKRRIILNQEKGYWLLGLEAIAIEEIKTFNGKHYDYVNIHMLTIRGLEFGYIWINC